MRHHANMESLDIIKLASESSLVRKTHARVSDLIDLVVASAHVRFKRGKRLRGDHLKAIVDDCMQVISHGINPLRTIFAEVPATRARPKSEVYEVRFLAFEQIEGPFGGYPAGELFQLFSFYLRATRKSVEVQCERHPLAFSYHAAERMFERSTGTEQGLRRVASALAEWALMIHQAEHHARAKTNSQIALPMPDFSGALLGTFVDEKVEPRYSVRTDGNGRGECSGRVDEARRVFVVRTFVDRYLLVPTQSYAMNLLTLWRAEAGASYEELNQRQLWIYGDGMVDYSEGECQNANKQMLSRVFSDPAFQRAVYPHKFAKTNLMSDSSLQQGPWRNDIPARKARVASQALDLVPGYLTTLAPQPLAVGAL